MWQSNLLLINIVSLLINRIYVATPIPLLLDFLHKTNKIELSQWLLIHITLLIYFGYATITVSFKLLLFGYFMSFVFCAFQVLTWNLNDSRQRTFIPNSYNLISLILWPLQQILYIYCFPYNICIWLYYAKYPEKGDYYNAIIQAAMILHVKPDPGSSRNDMFIYDHKNICICWLYGNKPIDVFIKFDKTNIYKFRIDDEDVNEDEYMGALWLLQSAVEHPTLHSFVNRNQLNNSNSFVINMHSQFINASAWIYPPGWLGHNATKESLFECLKHNWDRKIPSTHIINKIQSKHFDDIGKCRRILFKHFVKYKLGTDFESYFICGFLHSIEHYFIYKNFKKTSIYFKGFDRGFVHHQYVYPAQIPLFNSRLATIRYYDTKWNELYTEIKKINKEMADNCYMSLCQ